MKLSNSKNNTCCEKPFKKYNINTPPKDENVSICSCTNCDSFECFALRNKGWCPCKQDKAQKDCQGNKKQVYSNCQSKYSLKTVKISEKDSALKEHVKKEITYEYNNNNNVMSTVKKHSKYSYNYCIPALENRDNTDDNRTELSTEQPTYSLSETVTSSRKEFDTNAAQLSAQIMNVPYKDFTESISHSKPETLSPKPTKLSRYDIFKRIKEAYKACSCKVCECLIGKTTTRNEYCKCKPCECKDCASLLKSFDYKGKIQQLYLGCPCIRCDRRDCKGVIKKGPLAYCDCDPCDCLKCTDSFTRPCNCQPCECLECRSYSVNKPRKNNTLVVASMREEIPRAYCQCSPCDCGECGQDFQMASSLRREMGTGINRPVNCSCDTCVNQSCETHDSNSCTCDIQKRLMRKPVEKDIRDYDIHRALIKKNVIERKSEHNNDTIAMFAAVGNNFLKSENKNKSCNCGDCECVVCICKENNKTLEKQKPFISCNLGACKCSPCECEICNYTNKTRDSLYHNISCECNVCQCLKCDALSIPSTSNDENRPYNVVLKNKIPTNACKCSLCECIDCQKMMYKCTGDGCYCSSCNCQMCSDQSKLINEAANRYRDNYSSFKYHKDMTGKCFANQIDHNTYLTSRIQQPVKEQATHLKSGQNLATCNTPSEKELKDNPVRKSTQVLTSNNSQFRDHRPNKEKKIVQSYCRPHEYDSSGSFISSSSKLLNFQPNLTSIDLKNQSKPLFECATIYNESDHNNVAMHVPLNRCLDDNIGCDIKNNNSFKNFHKPIESQNSTIQRFFKTNPNYNDYQYCTEKYQSMTNEFGGIYSPVSLDKCNDEASATLCLDNNINRSDESSKRTNINDLSRSLVTSLQNANKRLSTLMQPKLSNHDSTLRPSKANISLPTNSIIKRKIIRNDNQENVTSFQNCYKNCTEDFSDIEINFEKVTNTLQQAKAFSVELTKVLKDYQMANNKLESKFLKDSIGMNIYSNPKLFPNLEQSTYNIEINQSINSDAYYEELFSHVGHDRSPYDPVKKYGSHNLNVTAKNKNKHEKFEMDEKTDCSNKIVFINSEIDHAVDEDLISYESTYKQQNKENVSHQLSKENIPIDHSSQSDRRIDGDLDEKFKFCKHRCRSNKTQKNVKSGNRLRVPRSLILYKRLKLKEALINLASATCTGTRQNLEPQSFQVSNRALITNSTTQDEQFSGEKRETTSTSTDMLGSYEHSRFTQPVQADQTLENSSWSILKKNCILNSPYLKNKGFSIMPPLLLEVKDTLRAISRQSGEAGRSNANNEVKVTGHGNKALLKLQTEVNRLWESSVPQSSDESASKTRSPMIKSEFDLKAKSFNVASSQTCNVTSSIEKAVDCMDNNFSVVGKSGCDTFKVKFLGLRRVSDHTVLVKWKAPPNVSRVQGYELLVDGRAVQKILSPTRCMAVVTCLPHIERVLITIRTLLPPGLDRPHYPSATIVYQPRAK